MLNLRARISFIAACISLLVFTIPVRAQTEDILRPKRPAEMSANASSRGANGGYQSGYKPFSQFRVGIDAGVAFSMMTRDIDAASLPSISSFDALRELDGFSPNIGAFIDASLTRRLGLQLRFSYVANRVSSSKNGLDSCTADDGAGGTTTSLVTTSADIVQKSSFFGIAPALRVDVDDNNSFTVGALLQFRTSSGPDVITFTATDDSCIIYPDDPQFSTKRVSLSYAGTVNSTRAAVEASFTHREPIAKNLFLYGTLSAQMFLTPWADRATDTFSDPELLNPQRLVLSTDVSPEMHVLLLNVGLMWSL